MAICLFCLQEVPSLIMTALTGGKLQTKMLSPPVKDNKIAMPPICIPKNYPVKSAGNLTPQQLAFITKAMEREKNCLKNGEAPAEPTPVSLLPAATTVANPVGETAAGSDFSNR